MSKKGQLYIIGAIIFIGMSILLLKAVITPAEPSNAFDYLAQNFEFEAYKALNAGLLEGNDLGVTFQGYWVVFGNYANEYDLSVITAIRTGNNITLYNLADSYAKLPQYSLSVDAGDEGSVAKNYTTLIIEANQNIYKFSLTNETYQFMYILMSERGLNREVKTNE